MTTRRVQLDMSPKSFERLQLLKDKVEAASYSEVVKDALRLYEFFVDKNEEGTKFYIQENEKQISALNIFI